MSEEIVKISNIQAKSSNVAGYGISQVDFKNFVDSFDKKHASILSLVATTSQSSTKSWSKVITNTKQIIDNQKLQTKSLLNAISINNGLLNACMIKNASKVNKVSKTREILDKFILDNKNYLDKLDLKEFEQNLFKLISTKPTGDVLTRNAISDIYLLFDLYTSDSLNYFKKSVSLINDLEKHTSNIYTLFDLYTDEQHIFNKKVTETLNGLSSLSLSISQEQIDRMIDAISKGGDVQKNKQLFGKQINTIDKSVDQSVKISYTGDVNVRDIKDLLESKDIWNPIKINLLKRTFKDISQTISEGLLTIKNALIGNGDTNPVEIISSANEFIKAITNILQLNNSTTSTSYTKSLFGKELFNIQKESSIFSKKNKYALTEMIDNVSTSISNAYVKISNVKPTKKVIDSVIAINDLFQTINDIISPKSKTKSKTIFGKELYSFESYSSVEKDAKNFSKAFSIIINSIEKLFTKINEIKINKNKINVVTSSIDELLQIIINNKVKIKDSISLSIIGFGVSVLGKSLIALGKSEKLISKGAKVLINLIDSLEDKLGTNKAKRMTNSIKNISIGIATLGITMVAFAALSPVIAISAGVLFLFSKSIQFSIGKSTTVQLALFTTSLAALGLTIWAFSEVVNTDTLLPVVGAMAALAGAIWLFNGKGAKFGGITTQGPAPYKTLMYVSAGLAALGLSVYLWQKLNLTWNAVGQVVVGIGALAGATWAFQKVKDVSIMKMIGVSLGLLAIGGVAWTWNKWGITSDDLVQIGVATVGLGVVMQLWKNVPVTASINLALSAAAIWVLGKGVQEFKDADWKSLAQIGVLIGGLGVAAMLMGNPIITLGAVNMLLIGGSIIALGVGLNQVAKSGITTDKSIEFTKSLSIITLGYVALAVPAVVAAATSVLFIPILTTTLGLATTMMLISNIRFKEDGFLSFKTGTKKILDTYNQFGVIELGKIALKATATVPIMSSLLLSAIAIRTIAALNIDTTRIKQNAESMGIFIETMANTFGNVEDKLNATRKGIYAVSGLAGTIKSLADAVYSAANLEYTENKIQNGKLVPVNTRKLNDTDFKRVGEGIATMLNSLIEPLVAIGSQQQEFSIGGIKITNPFSGNKVKKGIDSLKDIGNIFTPLAELIKSFSGAGVFGQNAQNSISNINLVIGNLLDVISKNLEKISVVEFKDTKGLKKSIESINSIYKSIDELVINLQKSDVLSDNNKDGASKLVNILDSISTSIINTVTKFSTLDSEKSNIVNTTKSISDLFKDITNINTNGLTKMREEIDKMYDKLKDTKVWNTFRVNFRNYQEQVGKIVKHINGIELEKAVLLSNLVKDMKDADENGNIERLIEKITELIGNIEDTKQVIQQQSQTTTENITNLTNNITNQKAKDNNTEPQIQEKEQFNESQIVAELRKIATKLNSKLVVSQATGEVWKIKNQ